MPQAAALDLLLRAYREEIAWLLARAQENQTDNPSLARDYIHRANNLLSILEGYERLHAKAIASEL
jgi:hypothetical protein